MAEKIISIVGSGRVGPTSESGPPDCILKY